MERAELAALVLAVCCAVATGLTRKYYYMNSMKSWAEAQSHCRNVYTDLATMEIESSTEQLLAATGNLIHTPGWVGLYSVDSQNWQWSSGEQVINYNWRRNLFCATVNAQGTWEDQVCYEKSSFMCFTETNNGTQKYTLIKQNKTWDEARVYCRGHHTDLVTIGSPRENQEVKESAQGRVVWIGLFNDPWEWSDGASYSFRYWNSQQPNRFNENQKCVEMYFGLNGRWNDQDCNFKRRFLCSHDANGLAVAVTDRFRYYLEQKSWPEAQSFCRSLGGDLATINNTEVFQQRSLLQDFTPNDTWIGLYRDKEKWQWVNGEGLNYANWQTKGPCAAVDSDGYWIDSVCDVERPFVCYENVRELVLVRENKTWEEALDHCRFHYTDLTSIVSEKEHNLTALTTADAQTSHVWLGLRQSFITSSWFWVNREVLGYQKWVQAGQPQCPQSRYCGAMSNTTEGHAWTDRPCKEKLNFICYRA